MIDWVRVNELREEVGEEDFDEVVTLFLSEVEERLEEMMSATTERNLEEDMHFLKGSALNLGFVDVAALCQQAESMAAADEITTISAADVNKTYQASKRHFLDAERSNAA